MNDIEIIKSLRLMALQLENRTRTLPCHEACGKCGSQDVTRKLRRAGEKACFVVTLSPDPESQTKQVKKNSFTHHVVKADYIRNQCNVCGHVWAGNVLSSPEGK